MTSAFVQSLHIYPIKSSSGLSLSKSWVDELGLSFDRRFVLTELNGQFITARTKPKLCLIQSHLTPDGLVITAPDMPVLKVNFANFSEQYHSVTVWNDNINALYCHQHYDKWFSQYLGMPCQLHYFSDKSTRQVKQSNKQVSFADGYPLLLISQASLTDLNKKLASHQVSMTQFRPNIVVNNTQAFEEDEWHHIRIGEVEFEVSKPCSRCVFTTIDPLTGEKHAQQEPLSTLKSYRQVASGDVMFGQNLIALNTGQVKQNDEVIVLKKQAKPVFISDKPQATNEKKNKANKKLPEKVSLLFDSWDKLHQGNTKEPILDQGESAGLVLPYSCRGGMCGRCKIKLESGQVKQLADDGLTEEEKEQGYVLACSSIPQSDLVLSSGQA